jgi:hypothetical protein
VEQVCEKLSLPLDGTKSVLIDRIVKFKKAAVEADAVLEVVMDEEKEEVEEVEEVEEAKPDLKRMKKAELQALAKKLGVEHEAKCTNSALVKLLEKFYKGGAKTTATPAKRAKSSSPVKAKSPT